MLGQSGFCRYCHKESPEVSFSKEAHAIPHLLGNNEIFSQDECNSCNEFFGNGYDDDLSKYLGGMRTLSQIPGKQGVPSYKTKQKLSRIDVEEDGVKMVSTYGDEIVHINEKSNTAEIEIQKQPYSPLGVYKSLVKMAIALAHQDILPQLDLTRQWLIRNDIDKYPYFRPFMIQTFIPGPAPMENTLFAMLLKRSKEVDMPSLVFWLSVSNYCFQIPVPCPELDQNLFGHEIKFPRIPHILEGKNPYGPPIFQKVDLFQKEKVYNQSETVAMHYDKIILRNTPLDEVIDPDLEAALKDLQDARLEAEEEGFLRPSDEALRNAEQVLRSLYDTWACRYEVYPMPDGEIAIHVRGGPRKSVALLFEPEGQVLCLVSLGANWRRARYSNSATLPDAFVMEALKELRDATGEQIAK